MTAILTITLNPSVDIATSVEHVEAGPKLRCSDPLIDPGGGGVNVSRAIAILGGTSTALAAVGGTTGDQLTNLLVAEGVALRPMPAPGATRQSIAVTETATGAQFRFVLPGPLWSTRDEQDALDRIGAELARDMLVVLSGSQPPGLSDAFPTRAAALAAERGARMVLDTSGAALSHFAAHATAGGPGLVEVLRMDHLEAEALAGRVLPERADSADFAQSLVRQGLAQVVILARGGDGSTLATATERLHAPAADVPIRSKVGAGDSFVGAFTLALARGADLGVALSHGSAAASAAVMSDGTRLCTRADAERLLAECVTVPV